MGVFAEIQSGIGAVRERAGAAVVGVGARWGIGSGIVVGKDRVLTNAHNLRGSEVSVTFPDGRVATATVAAADVDGDLAVLTVDTQEVRPLEWGPEAPAIGAPVFAMSNPGGKGLRATFGIVSGTERSFRGPRGRRIAGSIEHTAPLLPGSSGGPIVDTEGRLLGINTNRLGEGFYLAIPADEAMRRRVDALAKGETPARPRLGVGIVPRHVARRMRRAVGLPDVDGLLVRGVEEGSPAAVAGIEDGDMITAAGGRAVADADALHDALEAAGAGASIELTLVRGTDERHVTVQLGA